MLAAQNLSIDQILPLEMAAAREEEGVEEQVEDLPIVSPSAAIHDAQIARAAVIETVPLVTARLNENRARPAPRP